MYHRINVDFSPEARELLRAMAEQLQTTEADILRKSLGLLRAAIEADRRGEIFLLEKPRLWGILGKEVKQVFP